MNVTSKIIPMWDTDDMSNRKVLSVVVCSILFALSHVMVSQRQECDEREGRRVIPVY